MFLTVRLDSLCRRDERNDKNTRNGKSQCETDERGGRVP